jgi:hypothetical protein
VKVLCGIEEQAHAGNRTVPSSAVVQEAFDVSSNSSASGFNRQPLSGWLARLSFVGCASYATIYHFFLAGMSTGFRLLLDESDPVLKPCEPLMKVFIAAMVAARGLGSFEAGALTP